MADERQELKTFLQGVRNSFGNCVRSKAELQNYLERVGYAGEDIKPEFADLPDRWYNAGSLRVGFIETSRIPKMGESKPDKFVVVHAVTGDGRYRAQLPLDDISKDLMSL